MMTKTPVESRRNNIEKLIKLAEDAAKTGAALADQLVLRALRLPEIQKRLSDLLDRNYTLISCAPVPSATADITHVQFQLLPPPGSAVMRLPSVIGSFNSTTNEFISISDQPTVLPAQDAFGALPFALATQSFAHSTTLPDSDPHLQAAMSRREVFTENLMANTTSLIAIPTTHDTTSQTTYQCQKTSTTQSSMVTTPHDNDMTNDDTKTEWQTDYKTDSTTDRD